MVLSAPSYDEKHGVQPGRNVGPRSVRLSSDRKRAARHAGRRSGRAARILNQCTKAFAKDYESRSRREQRIRKLGEAQFQVKGEVLNVLMRGADGRRDVSVLDGLYDL